jgi:predicted nucleotidyltransferase
MQQSPSPLLPIFRSALQGDLLAHLLGEPERGFTVAQLARITEADASTVSREVSRLVGAGLVREERVGRTRVLRGDQGSPFFPELSVLVTKAFGPGRAAGATFGQIPGVTRVVVFGSWAARAAGEPGRPPRDLDVLVVGSPSRIAVHRAADELSERLALPVQVTFATEAEWQNDSVGVIQEIRRRPYQEFSLQEGT